MDFRIDVKLLKYEIHNKLEIKNKGYWNLYWNSLQKYLLAKISNIEFTAILDKLFVKQEVQLHNALITAVLHNSNSMYLPKNYDQYVPKRFEVENEREISVENKPPTPKAVAIGTFLYLSIRRLCGVGLL